MCRFLESGSEKEENLEKRCVLRFLGGGSEKTLCPPFSWRGLRKRRKLRKTRCVVFLRSAQKMKKTKKKLPDLHLLEENSGKEENAEKGCVHRFLGEGSEKEENVKRQCVSFS